MSAHLLSRPVAHPARVAVPHSRGSSWLAWLAAAMRAIETRRHLAQMDERMLKDIGVTRSQALEEANRAPWDLSPSAPHAPWNMR
jgi:uncharacterized protein YjiS (DUF1127 family)